MYILYNNEHCLEQIAVIDSKNETYAAIYERRRELRSNVDGSKQQKTAKMWRTCEYYQYDVKETPHARFCCKIDL